MLANWKPVFVPVRKAPKLSKLSAEESRISVSEQFAGDTSLQGQLCAKDSAIGTLVTRNEDLFGNWKTTGYTDEIIEN